MAVEYDHGSQIRASNCTGIPSGHWFENPAQGTGLAWFRFGSDNDEGRLIDIGNTSDPGVFHKWELTADPGGGMRIGRATDDLLAFGDWADSWTTGLWEFTATSWDTTLAAEDQYGYGGNLTTPAYDTTYYTQVGSGSVRDPSGAGSGITIGNIWGGAHKNNNPQVTVAWIGFWNYQMSLDEIISQQFRPRVTNGCQFFVIPNGDGSGTHFFERLYGMDFVNVLAPQADNVPLTQWDGAEEYIRFIPGEAPPADALPMGMDLYRMRRA